MHVTNEESKPWDQMEGESDLWYGRFRSYLLMGFKRSVNAVYDRENKEKQGKTSTKIGPEWYDAAKIWKWVERARLHDKHQRDEEDKIIAQERDKVLRTDFALDYKRIEVLNKFVKKMEQWADDDDKIWLIKTQSISGENFSKHTEETVFNAPMLTMMDKYLDSIAKEKGERVKKQEVDVTNTNDRDVQMLHEDISEALKDEPTARIKLAERLAKREQSN